jgi:hypothetical protein
VRLFFGLAEVQTGHLQAIIGTPKEVPQPSIVTSIWNPPDAEKNSITKPGILQHAPAIEARKTPFFVIF